MTNKTHSTEPSSIIPFTFKRELPTDHPSKAKKIVSDFIYEGFTKEEKKNVTYEVFIVWFCKTLQNWKALVSSTLEDGLYYEVTYNGNKKKTYIDVYEKLENYVVSD